jgi:hypothetical protein
MPKHRTSIPELFIFRKILPTSRIQRQDYSSFPGRRVSDNFARTVHKVLDPEIRPAPSTSRPPRTLVGLEVRYLLHEATATSDNPRLVNPLALKLIHVSHETPALLSVVSR